MSAPLVFPSEAWARFAARVLHKDPSAQAALAAFGAFTAGAVIEKGDGLAADFCVYAKVAPGQEPVLQLCDDEDELDVFQGESERILDNEYLGTLKFPPEAAGQRVSFNLDEECLLHVTVEGVGTQPKEVLLATQDTPDALKNAWIEENERRRKEAERQKESEKPKGFFAAIRKAITGEE